LALEVISFSASAVPEPGTYAMMALGPDLIALRRRRRG